MGNQRDTGWQMRPPQRIIWLPFTQETLTERPLTLWYHKTYGPFLSLVRVRKKMTHPKLHMSSMVLVFYVSLTLPGLSMWVVMPGFEITKIAEHPEMEKKKKETRNKTRMDRLHLAPSTRCIWTLNKTDKKKSPSVTYQACLIGLSGIYGQRREANRKKGLC